MRILAQYAIITIGLLASYGAAAQQSVQEKSTKTEVLSPPITHGAPVAQGDQSNPQQQQADTAKKPVILNAPQSPQDQQAGGNGSEASKRVGADEAHGTNEAIIANFTIALAIATFLLMVATFALWWETRKLAAQAKEASSDNKASIEIAKRSAEAAERSATASLVGIQAQKAAVVYKSHISGSVENSLVGGEYYDNAMIFAIEWVNVGPTVAIDVAFHISEFITRPNDTYPEYNPEYPPGSTGFALGTGVSGRSSFIFIKHKDVIRLLRKELSLHVASSAVYKTIQSPDQTEVSKILFNIDVTKIEEKPEGGFNYTIMINSPMR